MEFNKKGILARAKATSRDTAVVTDEGLRAYMLKVYNYGNRNIANRNNCSFNI